MNQLTLGRIRSGLRDYRPVRLSSTENCAWASVALVLHPNPEVRDEIELLFIRRARKEGDPWSGHMAFPGGRNEISDTDLLHTAQRETFEEVGIDLSVHGELLASLDDVVSPVRTDGSSLAIRPYVFLCMDKLSLKPNHEVARCYWFSLKDLMDPSLRETFPYRWKDQDVRLPVIRIDDADIWGISLRMLESFLRVSEGAL